ncbi:MAG: hypothetical protein JNJ54_20885 [Myxococcaceae bacterium]|nr:hypothetical protein [Myxococcaceae bacterium]
MLLQTALAVAIAAEPTALFVQARTGVGGEELKRALTTLDTELIRAGDVWTIDETARRLKAAGVPDATTCGGKLQCLLDAGKRVQAKWVVTISASKVGRDRAWALAAFVVESGAQLAREEWLDETNADVTGPVTAFANRLAPLIKPKDAPVVAVLEPPPPPPIEKPVLVEAAVEPASRPLPKVLLVAAAVAGAAAVGLAIASGVNTGTLNQVAQTTPEGLRLSPHSTSQAQALAGTSNALTGAAIASGVVAAGLGVGAMLTW